MDFNRRLLTVEGRNAKNRQTRHVPLNEEAVNVLRNWREQAGTGARVFDVVGFQTAWETVLKRARISKFRWHDLRHHFASRLIQQGVPLKPVRDLLGHSSAAMSALPTSRAHSASRRSFEAQYSANPLRCDTSADINQR